MNPSQLQPFFSSIFRYISFRKNSLSSSSTRSRAPICNKNLSNHWVIRDSNRKGICWGKRYTKMINSSKKSTCTYSVSSIERYILPLRLIPIDFNKFPFLFIISAIHISFFQQVLRTTLLILKDHMVSNQSLVNFLLVMYLLKYITWIAIWFVCLLDYTSLHPLNPVMRIRNHLACRKDLMIVLPPLH